MRRAGAWALVAALGAGGCVYDLDALRGVDAGPDRGTDRPGDLGHDLGQDLGLDAATDTYDASADPGQDQGQGRVGTCRSHGFADVVLPPESTLDAGVGLVPLVGQTVVIDNRTSGTGTMQPPAFGTCTSSAGPAPEQVYRYVVQRGPRLVATTDGNNCGTGFDTVLYALRSCDADAGAPLECNDDISAVESGRYVLCQGTTSTIEVGGLVPGDTVYLVVDGYNASSGPFRLRFAENAALPVALPASGAATPCVCPTPRPPLIVTSTFPQDATLDQGEPLSFPGATVRGRRPIGLTKLTGVAASFRLSRNDLPTTGSCARTEAIIDLRLNGTVVASFAITSAIPAGTTVNVLYTSFPTVTLLPDAGDALLEYRLRSFRPTGCAGSVEIDWKSQGTVTLVGHT